MRKAVIATAAIFLVFLVLIITSQISDNIRSSTLNNPDISEEPENAPLEQILGPEIYVKDYIENMHYLYSPSSYSQADREIWILTNMIKIRLLELGDYLKLGFDTVYLNLSDQTAVGYCEGKANCADRNKPTPVFYEDYIMTIPSEWVKNENVENLGSDSTSGRRSKIIRYTSDDKTITAWINEVFNLPNKVEVKSPSPTKNHFYTYLDFNVKPEQVAHQELFNYRS